MISRPAAVVTVMHGSVEAAVGGDGWQRVRMRSSVPSSSLCQRNTVLSGADGGMLLNAMLSVRWNRFAAENVPAAASLKSVVTPSPKQVKPGGQTVVLDSSSPDTNPGLFVGTLYCSVENCVSNVGLVPI